MSVHHVLRAKQNSLIGQTGLVTDYSSIFGRWERLIIEGTKEIEGFADFIETELGCFGPNFICAALSIARARELSKPHKLELLRAIMHEKRADLLSRLIADGNKCRPLTIAAIRKLNTVNCSRTDYLRLIGYLRQPSTEIVIRHARFLSPAIIRSIWRMPDWICLPNLLPLLDDPEVQKAFNRVFGERLWDMSSELQVSIRKSLKTAVNKNDLVDKLSYWAGEVLQREKFPALPIPGNELLWPLSSARLMRSEAREMRNCLHKLIPEVMAGSVYFYSWRGRERATVLVISTGVDSKYFAEIKGQSNAPTSQETENKIRSILDQQFNPIIEPCTLR
jgi:hypothetical protein